MRNRGERKAHSFLAFIMGLSVIAIAVVLSACGSPKSGEPAPGPSKYEMSGRVVSIDKGKEEVTVDAADIPGFMSAMTMPYDVKNPNLLEPLSPGDQITADVMVNGNDVWLENIVVKKPDQANAPASNDAHPAPPSGKQQ